MRVCSSTPSGVVRRGHLFRSDSLAHAAPDDVVHLVEERGVCTVVDLRGAAEVDAFPNQPMADAGVTIHHVPLIDPEKREQSGLDWETMTLVDLYRFLLESAGTEFVEVLQIIAEQEQFGAPVLSASRATPVWPRCREPSRPSTPATPPQITALAAMDEMLRDWSGEATAIVPE